MRRLVLAIALAAVAAPPAAAQIGGATYTGTHNAGRGGPVSFKLDGEGNRVVSYSFSDVAGDNCTFVGAGDEGVWEGAALSAGGAFSYRLFDSIAIDGRFDGRSATGTLRLRNRRPCDSGTVEWSAAAPGGTPPPLPGVTPTPTPAPSTPNPDTTRRRTVLASIIVGRRGTRITGRLRSSDQSCHAKRKLTLKRRTRTVVRVTKRSDGTFTVKRSSKTRNKVLRVSAARITKPALICGAVTSSRFRG